MTLNVQLVIIDPQKDFMDDTDSALPVPGANDDMNRLALLIDRVGKKLEDIHVTMDSHHTMDYRHPGSWKDQNGQHPLPITKGGELITANKIDNDIWIPYGANTRPEVLGGKTVKQFMIECAINRESKGIPGLEIWPEHCIIGTDGWSIQKNLRSALTRWERAEKACVDVVTKGTNVYTEHYGGLSAEVPLPNDPSTGLNADFLSILANADIIPVAGQALSHCVMSTVNQIADNIGQEHIKKFHILTDCSSPVPKVGAGPDFPAMAKAWLNAMEARGMHLVTSDKFMI